MTLHQMNFCVYAWILIVSSADETYRDRVLQQYFKQLVPPLLYFPLPKHNFNVRNPFAFNGTLYRFNLTDGKLFVKTPNSTKFDGTTCNIAVWPYKRVMCIFPIDDSWANYTGKLSYGKPVVQTFQVNLTVEAYTLENSGWNNPADIFVYLEPRENETRLKATHVRITDFIVNVKVQPPFETFWVFCDNQTIIQKVWADFSDYAYRKGRPDIQNVAVASFKRQLAENARNASPINASLFWY
ncbi:uncharacterized protein LOC142817379 isoform X1 [Rhipicephalus microplus]|uniref:uncharacterized protein LOC142817379 isoform X1 n=1 Tax=Rhipicephalus microplus TaxID=6941 RepID=UPI003F6B8008